MKDNSNARLICSFLHVGSDDDNPGQVQVKLVFYSLKIYVYIDQDFNLIRCCDIPVEFYDLIFSVGLP